jgi:hypothetical protein
MNLARRLAMAVFLVSVVLAPIVGQMMVGTAIAALAVLVVLWLVRRLERDDPYDFSKLQDVDERAEWENADPNLAPDADRLICPHCGEENDAARPFCRRCGAIQI